MKSIAIAVAILLSSLTAEAQERRTLTDQRQQPLGSTTVEGKDVVIRDNRGNILGRYNPQENVTRDKTGRIIGKGDHSSGLIYEQQKPK